MNLIIPMAGRGSRLRPHTLTVPKPLVSIVGKPIVQRIAEDLVAIQQEKVENIAFIIHPSFGKEVEKHLIAVAEKLGANGHICYQHTPDGTAHAIYAAKTWLTGKVTVAFADTLFKATKTIDTNQEGVIYVQEVEDPSAFGVVKLDANGIITDFIEKPATPVSKKAIIGIYYFKNGDALRHEIEYLLENDIREKGEYQLTNALENLKQKGTKFTTSEVEEWLDCGNFKACIYSNQRILSFNEQAATVSKNLINHNSVIIAPCYIADGVTLENTVVGPHVSIGENTRITQSVVKNSIIQSNTTIENQIIHDSMIGHHATIQQPARQISIGDYTSLLS